VSAPSTSPHPYVLPPSAFDAPFVEGHPAGGFGRHAVGAPGPSAATHRRERPAFRPARKRHVARIVVALLLGAAGATGAFFKLKPLPVTTTPIVRGTAVDGVYATGVVEAQDRVAVKARVPGSIAEIKVREGDVVRKDDLLATIDSPTTLHDLERGRADLEAARAQAKSSSPQIAVVDAQSHATLAQLKVARAERERLAKLVASGSVATPELERAEAQVAGLEAQLASQYAQRRSLKIELSARASGARASVGSLAARQADTEVRAPFDGVVLGRSVEVGELVSVGQALVRIGDTRRLVLECAIDEADVARVRVGAKAAVSFYAFRGKAFKGEVVEIFPDADRIKKTFLTRIRLLEPPQGLRSGMSAEVNVIVTERPAALLAPADAVDANGVAWVVKGGKTERRTLRVGVRDALAVEILEGVGEGDELVMGSTDALKPGTRVTATRKPMNREAPQPARPKMGL
jgi:HlyD family secretion protein